MNIILIAGLMILFVATFVLSLRFQTLVVGAFQLAGVVGQGLWARLAGAIGTGWRVARMTLLALVILWFVNLFAFWGVGVYANAPWCGFALGIVIPSWSVLYILSMIPVVKQAIRPIWVISNVVMWLVLPFFLFGLWSPSAKGSYDSWSGNQKQVLSNFFTKKSIETNVMISGTMIENSAVYNKSAERINQISRGSVVKVIGESKTGDGEKMTKIMFPNSVGDFINGNTGFVPSRKLQIGDNEQPIKVASLQPEKKVEPAPERRSSQLVASSSPSSSSSDEDMERAKRIYARSYGSSK